MVRYLRIPREHIEEEINLKFSEEQVKKYSRGTLIKKYKGKVEIEVLDIKTINNINERVLISIKQHEKERQQSEIIAKETFSN